MKKRGVLAGRLFGVAVLLVLLAVGLILSASAADLEWNLLTDAAAGYRMEDWDGTWKNGEEDDGTPYVYNENEKNGALYIFDDQNILGSYLTFSLEGDFYFSSFPTARVRARLRMKIRFPSFVGSTTTRTRARQPRSIRYVWIVKGIFTPMRTVQVRPTSSLRRADGTTFAVFLHPKTA